LRLESNQISFETNSKTCAKEKIPKLKLRIENWDDKFIVDSQETHQADFFFFVKNCFYRLEQLIRPEK
jgi:hypothetical protein